MEPPARFQEDTKDLDLYFEPLPTLAEDEEHVSLACILTLRARGLSEQEAWAVGRECGLSLLDVAHATLFQTLCISPDTLAFDTSGHVSFMEQLSDDPEGAFVPPEFDDTGNTFEPAKTCSSALLSLGWLPRDHLGEFQKAGYLQPPPQMQAQSLAKEAHIYSLGATLKAALDFVGASEPELEPETRWSHELETLLGQMQAQDPRDRPDLESVIVLCEQKLRPASSCSLCRCLSAVGRRVLSIESFSTFQARYPGWDHGDSADGGETTWTGKLAPRSTGLRTQPPDGTDSGDPRTPTHQDLGHPQASNPKALLSGPPRNGESPDLQELASMLLDAQHPLGALQPIFPGRSLRKVRTLPQLLPEGPEASLPLTSIPDSPTEASLSRQHSQAHVQPQPRPQQEECRDPVQTGLGESTPVPCQQPLETHSGPRLPGTPEGPLDDAPCPAHISAEQAVPLQVLLCTLDRPLKEYELWALSHACLNALRTQRQYPAYLCPDSVLVAKDGAVLFGPPPANGAYNNFFLAPEVAEQRLVTDKASVYCVAAVLWTAARFRVPRGQKLALPRRLKTLLLDMARRSPHERPAPAEAVKVCGTYLLQRGMDSRKVLAHLLTVTRKVDQQEETIGLQIPLSMEGPQGNTAHLPSSGFKPVRGDNWSVPHQEPVASLGATERPAAPTSDATHFRHVLLPGDTAAAREEMADSPEEHVHRQDGQGQGQRGQAAAEGLAGPEQPAAGLDKQPQPSPRHPCILPPPLDSPALREEAPPEQQPNQESTASTQAGQAQGTAPTSPGQKPRDPCLTADDPDSARDTPDRQQDDQVSCGHPQMPRTAEQPSCLQGLDGTPPPSLQEAMGLIQEQFAFDGYLDNGLEALIMGEYIFGLKDLTFATFCGAVSEKFCDLFWGEKLLLSLFSVVNGHRMTEEAPPQPQGGTCSPSSQRPPQRGAGMEQLPAPCSDQAPCPLPSMAPEDKLSGVNFELGFRPPRSVRMQETQAAPRGEASQGGPLDAEARPPGDSHPGGPSDAEARLVLPGEAHPAASWSCGPGWGSAFYEADCFGPDVQKYLQDLGVNGAAGNAPPSPHNAELEQQLLIEKRNFRKTLKFYQKLLQKEKRNKGSEVKSMVTKLKGQLEETRARVLFLGLVKRHLQVVYAEQWGLEPSTLPLIVHLAEAPCDSLDFSPLDESSSLIFYNVSKQPRGGQQLKGRVLQAGTPLGLMAYLYSSNAFLEGYVQQFLYTFRYFCTPQDFLHFLLARIRSTLPRAQHDPTSTFAKIYKRSLCILQAWVEDCGALDFSHNPGLLGTLRDFLSSQVLPLDSSVEPLLALLAFGMERWAEGSQGADMEAPSEADEDTGPLNTLCRRLAEDGLSRKSFPWRLTWGHGPTLPLRERPYTIAAALPRPCLLEDVCGPHSKAGEKGPCFLTQHSAQQLSSQLTLLQQELFQKCHPVHFLNSRALGVVDQSTATPRASAAERQAAGTCSLFLPGCTQDPFLLQLLRHAEDISTWVAAEIVTCHGSKLQVSLLSKFLLTAKCCYEQRNFATAMQILRALEHPAVRQAPAWRILPAKIAEVLEELKAVEVFLKSDSLCLMEGRRFRAQPTLPSARLLAMHIQQLETGGFTMTNGAHRWSKLRNIARVASQVQAFQESPYTLAPEPKLQAHLRHRLARFSGADVARLAADPPPGPAPTSEKHARRLQEKLRRMRATFQ